jgi:hypothetical protein
MVEQSEAGSPARGRIAVVHADLTPGEIVHGARVLGDA